MVVITGNLVLTTPAISNVKRLIYRWVPATYVPQNVMNTTNPVGFNRPHKWVQGEIHLLSEAKTAMAAYVKTTTDNVELTMVATNKDVGGATHTYTFTGCVIMNESMTVNDGEDVITVYPFVAKYVAET